MVKNFKKTPFKNKEEKIKIIIFGVKIEVYKKMEHHKGDIYGIENNACLFITTRYTGLYS